MTVFEYIMVMVSLILALALAQGLRGLSETVRSPHRYLPHTLWTVMITLLVLQTWWAYWDFNLIDDWQVTHYAGVLVFPIILFTQMYLLVPATRTAETKWLEHFFAVKQWFLGLMIFMSFFAAYINVFMFDAPFLHLNRLFQGIFIAIWIIGLSTTSRQVHASLPWIYFVVIVVNQVVVRMDIGAMM